MRRLSAIAFLFALVLPLQIFGGSRFYKGAWTQLKAGQSNMDTLVSLGTRLSTLTRR